MPQTAREVALKTLGRCRRDGAFSDALLSSAVKEAALSPKDSALCTRLCYGVLQNAALCDFYIDSFSTGKSGKIEPKVRDILRLSVYQILFMDKIPPHAAVSEGVELCKKNSLSRASGFVNAILRKIVSQRDNLPEIPRDDEIFYLSVKYSHPRELVSLLLAHFDFDFTEGLLCANNSPVPTFVQLNTTKSGSKELFDIFTKDGINCRSHTFLPDCLEISDSGSIGELYGYKEGLFYVQDPAARLSILAAAPKSGDRVLDACAAPGGKSFAAAVMMENKGEIISCDLHKNKLSRIKSGAERLGLSIISAKTMDAAQPEDDFFESFDLVIADVPCSGLGVIRKKPDIRYKNTADFKNLPELQLSILKGLAPCVKKGGSLIYSTCTLLPEENEGLIARFLELYPNFFSEDFILPDAIGQSHKGMLSLYPHIHGTDGFFICKLRKSNEN